MRALVTQLRPDKTREKGLVNDWPEPPAPVGNQILIRTMFTGVTNGSERNDLTRGNYANPDEKLPAPWGYQNVGEVIATGPDCKLIRVGDIVYTSTDHLERTLIPEDIYTIKLDGLSDYRPAALYGMAGVAVHTLDHAALRLGERVLIVGAGYIGQIAAQVASWCGAHVSLVDVDERRLELARHIGAADEVLNTAGDGWANHIRDFAYDVVIDVAGVPGMENRLISATKHRGRVFLIAGRFKVDYEFNMGQGHEVTIRQNSHFTNHDLGILHHLVLRGRVRIEPLIQDVLPLVEAKAFYDRLRDNPGSTLGTVFVW